METTLIHNQPDQVIHWMCGIANWIKGPTFLYRGDCLGDNYTDYSNYKLTRKGKQCIMQAINKHNIDIRKPFDLFLITEHIERALNYNEMQYCRLFTTGEVMRALDYIREHDLDRDLSQREEE